MPHPTNFGGVTGPPPADNWTKDDLIAHVKTGMQVELGTMPIYLCAMYSINSDNGGWGTKARSNIRDVVQQEMLHLALAGNMLRALDGVQLLYDSSFLPTYPSQILFEPIWMKLQPANKENLECFLKIEAPYMPDPLPPAHYLRAEPPHILPDYNSIGEFYRQMERGIRKLVAQYPDLFSSNTDMQFTGDEFFDSKMTVITDERSALEAFTTIVDQGEGSIGVPESHYSIFVELYQRRKEWSCLDYIDEPQTSKYTNNQVAYRLSLAVNASYCYLLQTIDRCWQTNNPALRTQLFRNIHRIMGRVLQPLAMILVTQTLTVNGQVKHAAPCFEFYPPLSADPLPPSELRSQLIEEANKAQAASDSQTAQAIAAVMICLDSIPDV